MKNIPFTEALDAARTSNAKIQRADWSEKNMYVFLVKGDVVKQAIWEAYGDISQDAPDVWDALYMRTTQGELTPWLASKTDMLANDWAVL